MLLNLDTTFNPNPEKDLVHFETFTFKGGEPHIKIKSDLTDVEEITISQRIRSFNDLGLFVLAVDAVRRMGVATIKGILPYFPAARQDRVMASGEPFSLKVYADIINACQLAEVVVYDAHSDVTPAILNQCKTITNYSFIAKVTQRIDGEILLISPDGGALKKVYKLAKELQNYNVVECGKSRDIKTGKLSGFKVFTDDLQGKDLLIVDDICDGGGTFMGLAKALKAKNAGKLYLAVSHGIFSKGFEKLDAMYDHIYTTDAFSTLPNKVSFTQLNLSDGLLA
ncbi:MAG: ribose-phosphate diphosphokinase [Saprospiraceae bacterium]|nr:ribose-phosphate diphosphokinase [Saprospiraceae bacterium]